MRRIADSSSMRCSRCSRVGFFGAALAVIGVASSITGNSAKPRPKPRIVLSPYDSSLWGSLGRVQAKSIAQSTSVIPALAGMTELASVDQHRAGRHGLDVALVDAEIALGLFGA